MMTRLPLRIDPGPYGIGGAVSIGYSLEYFRPSTGEWVIARSDDPVGEWIYFYQSLDGGGTWRSMGSTHTPYRTAITGSMVWRITEEEMGKNPQVKAAFHGTAPVYEPTYPEQGGHLEACESEVYGYSVLPVLPKPPMPTWQKALIIGGVALVGVVAIGYARKK